MITEYGKQRAEQGRRLTRIAIAKKRAMKTDTDLYSGTRMMTRNVMNSITALNIADATQNMA